MTRRRANISVFLSYPKPHQDRQETFVQQVIHYLEERGIAPRTLGVTDYDFSSPLSAIRRLMVESNGLLALAFRRTLHVGSVENFGSTMPDRPQRQLTDVWSSSIWAHVEPAMAYQLGLPMLLVKESGVIDEAMYQSGVTGLKVPEFSLEDGREQFLASPEWADVVMKWEAQVRAVVDAKGTPPKLY